MINSPTHPSSSNSHIFQRSAPPCCAKKSKVMALPAVLTKRAIATAETRKINMSNDENENKRPMTGIESCHDNDVPMGRGGFVNSHKGHRRYLKMVQDRQLEYVTCKKADKMKIAWSIVRELRALDPPARFLRKDPATGLWSDVGDKKFREKVSQALREHQPFIKAVIETNGPDPEPLCTTKPHDLDSCWKLPTTPENQQPPSQKNLDDDYYYDQTPSILISAGKRRAFSETRNETNVNQIHSHEPERQDVGFNLSEFSVSHGPSFPDFEEESITVPSRRNSSGLDGLLDILKDHELDELTGNVSNLGLSSQDHASDGFGCSQDYERIPVAIQDPWDAHQAGEAQQAVQLKRTSDSERDYYDGLRSPVKRCVLSRDKSEVSRRIKEAYCGLGQPQIPLVFDDNDDHHHGTESLLSVFEKNFPILDHY